MISACLATLTLMLGIITIAVLVSQMLLYSMGHWETVNVRKAFI